MNLNYERTMSMQFRETLLRKLIDANKWNFGIL